MKVRTELTRYILDNSYAEKTYHHVIAGKRQTGKTTASVMGAILRGLESHYSKYRILIIVPTYIQQKQIEDIIYKLKDINQFNIGYKKQGHHIWLNIDEDIVFEIDLVSSRSLETIRGNNFYDFGVIEELNYCIEWKQCLGYMNMVAKDYIIVSEAVL